MGSNPTIRTFDSPAHEAEIMRKREYMRNWYWRNRDKEKERSLTKTKKKVTELRRWLWDIKKNVKCIRCGFSHPAAMQFHHRDPTTKEFEIGAWANKTIKKERIQTEIDKCDVLCANCHAIEHFTKRAKGVEDDEGGLTRPFRFATVES